MDKLKYVKLENEDGSYSDSIPIGADAVNVSMNNGKSVQSIIGDINVDRDGSIAEQLDKHKDYDSSIKTLYADVDSLKAKDKDLENDITIIKALTPPSTYTELSSKIFLFVGDSYADGGAGSSWAENIKTMLNLNSNSVNLSHGGAGFGTSPSNNFKLQLENYVSEHTISEREAVDYILVAGGANDFDNLRNGSITVETIKTRIEQFSIYAKNNFPNAKIYIAQIGRSFNGERWDYIRTVINLYRDTTLLGMNYINNSEYILHKSSLLYDNLHPTSEGNNLIAKGLIDGILKGGCEVHYYLSNHLRKVDGNNLDFQGNAYYQVQSSTDNGISTLTLKGFSGQYNVLKISGSETHFDGQEQKAMFEFEDSCFFGNFNNLYHGRTISQRVAIIAGGEKLWANLNMNIIDNKIYFQFMDLPYPVNITEIYIYPFTISAPSVDC